MEPQLSVPELIWQLAAVWLAIDQEMPEPVGSGSLMLTPVAVPVPAAPELATVTVNPIWDPAETETASAVLVSETFGHWTVVEAEDGAIEPWLVAEAVAVLG